LIASLEEIAADLDGAGLDSADVRQVAAVAGRERAVLDEVTEPRPLPGDLWTVNCLLDLAGAEPVITGVLDFDRAWFGAPDADWTIRMATARNDERTAFRETYGTPDRSPAARWRSRIYEARHLGALCLERLRPGKADVVAESYQAMAAVLADLT
jgi:aminoglycoside phosphotransferase (APT) family kinase protein